jgi:hypothetical protein
MSSKPGYDIREYRASDSAETRVWIAIDDISVLPFVLRRLHEMGYNLNEAYETLNTYEEQRKRKVLDEVNAIMKTQ